MTTGMCRRAGSDLSLAQNFDPVHPGHFQIEQNDARQTILPPGKFTLAIDIIERLRAILNDLHFVSQPAFLQCRESQFNIVLVIFRQ
jgi:hypothetical protein